MRKFSWIDWTTVRLRKHSVESVTRARWIETCRRKKSWKFSFIDSKTLIFSFMFLLREERKEYKAISLGSPAAWGAVLPSFIRLKQWRRKKKKRVTTNLCVHQQLLSSTSHKSSRCHISLNKMEIFLFGGKNFFCRSRSRRRQGKGMSFVFTGMLLYTQVTCTRAWCMIKLMELLLRVNIQNVLKQKMEVAIRMEQFVAFATAWIMH